MVKFCFSLDKREDNPFNIPKDNKIPGVLVKICEGRVSGDEFITVHDGHYLLENTLDESEAFDKEKRLEIEQKLLNIKIKD